MLCEYGCGKEAKYQFKNGKWCCESNLRRCLVYKKLQSENMKGYKHTSEAKQKLRLQRLGSQNPMYGKKNNHSIETCQKISNSLKGNKNWEGKHHSIESRKKISETRLRRNITHSPETCKKLSNSLKGKAAWNKDKKINLKDYKKYLFFSKIEKLREHPKTKEIQAHCKNHNCKNSKEQGGWFTPTYTQLYERIRQLEHPEGNGGSYLYCSDECKQECPLYHIKLDPNRKTNKPYTKSEYNTWRLEVLNRANEECEYCGNKATHAHHSRPQKLEPFHSLDPDFGIACCEKCHYEKGHKEECSTGKLSSVVC